MGLFKRDKDSEDQEIVRSIKSLNLVIESHPLSESKLSVAKDFGREPHPGNINRQLIVKFCDFVSNPQGYEPFKLTDYIERSDDQLGVMISWLEDRLATLLERTYYCKDPNAEYKQINQEISSLISQMQEVLTDIKTEHAKMEQAKSDIKMLNHQISQASKSNTDGEDFIKLLEAQDSTLKDHTKTILDSFKQIVSRIDDFAEYYYILAQMPGSPVYINPDVFEEIDRTIAWCEELTVSIPRQIASWRENLDASPEQIGMRCQKAYSYYKDSLFPKIDQLYSSCKNAHRRLYILDTGMYVEESLRKHNSGAHYAADRSDLDEIYRQKIALEKEAIPGLEKFKTQEIELEDLLQRQF